MTGQQRALRWLAAGVLVFWCGVFLRAENTEKSMVRALILTPPTVAVQSWMVSLLYQFRKPLPMPLMPPYKCSSAPGRETPCKRL